VPERVLTIRRYPVKSMGGEPLDRVELDSRGLVGDRWFAVQDDDGRFASGKDTRRFRRRDAVFAYAARTEDDGRVFVSNGTAGWQAGSPGLDAELTRAMGAPMRVTTESGVQHQDMGAVSLVGTATLRWCQDRWGLDADPRRLRVNLVVETDEPFVEEAWAGRRAMVGGVVALRVVERVPRCRTIDIDQDGALGGGQWLKHLAAERDLCVAMYADVVVPGTVRVGDALAIE
jgi:uncharacterized protein